MLFCKPQLPKPIRLQKSDLRMNWLEVYRFESLSDKVDSLSPLFQLIGPISLMEWNDVAE
jgi:hypothetical protein